MTNRLSHDDIQRLDNITALKLLMYLNEFLEKDSIKILRDKYISKKTMDADFEYAFNSWLSMDYIDEKGKTLIDYMIFEKKQELTPDEVNILIAKRESYMSIYEVKSGDFDSMVVIDKLLHKSFKIDSGELPQIVAKGDVFLARLMVFNDYVLNVGDVEIIHKSYLDRMIEEINKQYRFIYRNIKEYSMQYYLKKHSYSVYCIVHEILHTIKHEELQKKAIYEIESFKLYLSKKGIYSVEKIERYAFYLMKFQEKELNEHYISLEELNADYIYKFLIGISSCYSYNLEEITAMLELFKIYGEYLYFLGIISQDEYIKIYTRCNEKDEYYNFNNYFKMYINRYQKNLFNDMTQNFKMIVDTFSYLELAEVQKIDSEFILFEKFEDYIENKYGKRFTHRNLIKTKEYEKDIKKEKYELLFEYFAKNLELINLNEDSNFEITELYLKYKAAKPKEKFIVWVEYIWNKFDWTKLVPSNSKIEFEQKNKNKYLTSLTQLEVNIKYDFDKWRLGIGRENFSILNTGFKIYKSKIFIPYILYFFEDLGLVELDIRGNSSDIEKLHGLDITKFAVTNLGKEVMYYLIIRTKVEIEEKKIVKFPEIKNL